MKYFIGFSFLLFATLSNAQVNLGEQVQPPQGSVTFSDDGRQGVAKVIFIHDQANEYSRALLEYVFMTDPDFANFINSNYSAQLLLKEETRALDYKIKYCITSYPTVILLNPDGKLIAKVSGYQSGAELQKKLMYGVKLNQSGITFQSNGNNPPPFYREYFERGDSMMMDTMMVKGIMSAYPVIDDEGIWNSYTLFYPILGEMNERLFNAPDMVRQFIGQQQVNHFYHTFLCFMADTMLKYPQAKFESEITPIINKMNFDQPLFYQKSVFAHYTVYKKDWAKAPAVMKDYLTDSSSYLFVSDSVNNWCKFIYKNCNDKAALAAAEKSMSALPVLSVRPDFQATLGLLQFKNNKLYEAETNLKSAIRYPLVCNDRMAEIEKAIAAIESQKKKKKK